MKNREYQAILLLHTAFVTNSPKDTWNLALNAIRIVQDNGRFYIAIGGELAEYAEATNEKWESTKWGGKQNPNEGWIERTIELCLPTIKQIFSGEITQSELDEWKRTNFEKKLVADYNEHIAEKQKQLAAI